MSSCARSAATSRCASSTVSARLTGVADTSGRSRTSTSATTSASSARSRRSRCSHDLDDFLDRNLTDVVVIDIEDYVQPKDLKQALIDNGLWDRVWKPNPKQIGWPSLYDMVATKTKAQEKVGERPRRLVVMSEKHPGVYPWLLGAYDVAQESPYTFTSTSQFNCNRTAAATDKAFFILNHWLRPNGPPDPVAAAKVNSQKVLTARMQDCIAKRGQLPNVVAVDFTAIGDLYKTVDLFNAAIAKRSSVTPLINRAIRQAEASGELTDAEAADIAALRRLPSITNEDARALLGTGATTCSIPPVSETWSRTRPTPRPPRPPSRRPRKPSHPRRALPTHRPFRACVTRGVHMTPHRHLLGARARDWPPRVT